MIVIAKGLLREIKKETIHKYGYVSDSTPADRKEQPIPFYRTIETETYKPFNVANTFRSIHAHNTKTSDYYKIEHAFNEYSSKEMFMEYCNAN